LNYETHTNGFEFPEAETAPKIQIHQHSETNLDDLDPYTMAQKYTKRITSATAAQFDGSSNVQYYKERAQKQMGYRFAKETDYGAGAFAPKREAVMELKVTYRCLREGGVI
jgi:hypothetical protein